MKIVKQNETFTLSETTSSGWDMTGTASRTVSADISLNFRVQKTGELMAEIGDFNYQKNGNRVNINCNVTEDLRDTFMIYADTVIDTVLAHFINDAS